MDIMTIIKMLCVKTVIIVVRPVPMEMLSTNVIVVQTTMFLIDIMMQMGAVLVIMAGLIKEAIIANSAIINVRLVMGRIVIIARVAIQVIVGL